MSRQEKHNFLSRWVLRNVQVFMATLGRFYRNPVATLMTVTVIGITIALPSGMFVLLENLKSVSDGWDGGAQISLFLEENVNEEQAKRLQKTIAAKAKVASVQYISKEAALKEFKELSGFDAALDALGKNPLPSVLVVHPSLEHSAPLQLDLLVSELQRNPQVNLAQLDMLWVKRLYALIDLGKRGIFIITILLGLAVLLIIGNTIRLDINNRRDEIVIIKLVGATNAFVRRPFLHLGAVYGLFGGLIAWLLVQTAIMLLHGPVANLTSLYAKKFAVSGLSFVDSISVIAGATALGLLGAWIAVSRHLDSIEPR